MAYKKTACSGAYMLLPSLLLSPCYATVPMLTFWPTGWIPHTPHIACFSSSRSLSTSIILSPSTLLITLWKFHTHMFTCLPPNFMLDHHIWENRDNICFALHCVPTLTMRITWEVILTTTTKKQHKTTTCWMANQIQFLCRIKYKTNKQNNISVDVGS